MGVLVSGHNVWCPDITMGGTMTVNTTLIREQAHPATAGYELIMELCDEVDKLRSQNKFKDARHRELVNMALQILSGRVSTSED
jgi:hypothetical protein